MAFTNARQAEVTEKIYGQLIKVGVKLTASLPDDWVNNLITRVEKGNEIRNVRVGREAETIAVCAGAFFGGVRAAAIFGNTGLLTCTGEMATLCLRHMIPVFCIVSGRGSIDDHKVYQEVQGRRTVPLLQAYDYPYKVIDEDEEIDDIPNAYEWHRLQKRPFVLFLTKRLLGTNA
jgi:sulfopyruvate decarboxylase subunit alpha